MGGKERKGGGDDHVSTYVYPENEKIKRRGYGFESILQQADAIRKRANGDQRKIRSRPCPFYHRRLKLLGLLRESQRASTERLARLQRSSRGPRGSGSGLQSSKAKPKSQPTRRSFDEKGFEEAKHTLKVFFLIGTVLAPVGALAPETGTLGLLPPAPAPAPGVLEGARRAPGGPRFLPRSIASASIAGVEVGGGEVGAEVVEGRVA